MEDRDEGRVCWADGTVQAALGFGSDTRAVSLPVAGCKRPAILVTAFTQAGGWESRLYPPLSETPESAAGAAPSSSEPLRFGAPIRIEGLRGLRFLAPLTHSGHTVMAALGDEGLVLLETAPMVGTPSVCDRRSLGWHPAQLSRPVEVEAIWGVDWDGDGRQGLLVACHEIEGYWPDDGPIPHAQQIGLNQDAGNPAYDQGGRWRGRVPQPIFLWFKPTDTEGPLQFAAPVELNLEIVGNLGQRPALLVANWSGPGTAEMMLSNASGMVRVFRNFGGQRPPVMMDPRPLRLGDRPLELPDSRTSLVAADLDGDGRDELLVGLASGRVLAVRAGAGREQVKPAEVLTALTSELWLGASAVVAAHDLDGDGDADLIVGDRTGQLWRIDDEGTPQAPAYKALLPLEPGGEPFCLDPDIDGVLHGPRSPRLGFACPAVGDWSGHQRPDLIVAGAAGELLHFRNNGAPRQARFDQPRQIHDAHGPLFTPPRTRPALACWYSTSEPDLITLDMQGFLVVYPRTGPQMVGEPERLTDRLGRWLRLDGGFGLAGGCSLWAGPFTGSERIDILVGLSKTNRFVVPALTGEPLPLEDCPTVLLLENVGENVLIPRIVRNLQGQPLVIGSGGCSPNGVPRADGRFDMVIGTAEGALIRIDRDHISW